MSHTITLATSEITFAKIVSIPTLTAWSQVYNAGSLFAILSFTKKEEDEQDLNSLGKHILTTLEQEFFTLETKSLSTIKEAIISTCNQIPSTISSCFIVVSIPPGADNILYLFLRGSGKILIKRGEKTGTIIDTSEELTASSGYLEDNDTLLLETNSFSQAVPSETVFDAVSSATIQEVSDTFTPKVQEKGDGSTCAILIHYKKKDSTEQEETEKETLSNNQSISSEKKLQFNKFFHFPNLSLPFLKQRESTSTSLSHSKKIVLTIAIVLIIVLGTSIFFAIRKQHEAKYEAAFKNIYEPAQKKYDEGQSLIDLNKNLARDDFQQAHDMLTKRQPQFTIGSSQRQRIDTLLKKVDESFAVVSGNQKVALKEVPSSNSFFLSYIQKNQSSQPRAYTQDTKTVYAADKNRISSVDKVIEKAKDVVKNDNYWNTAVGLGLYSTNIYLLDKDSNQILKFVATDSGYAKSNYLATGITPDFANAVSLTIDNSAWVLRKDGTLSKFTRGKPDSFTISGLDQPLSSPTKIFTNVDTNNIYILDNGNSRIVVLDKNGVYLAQYQATILKTAVDFEVLEKEKRIYVLIQGKIYQIEIQ